LEARDQTPFALSLSKGFDKLSPNGVRVQPEGIKNPGPNGRREAV
jgi:hypothetical protein